MYIHKHVEAESLVLTVPHLGDCIQNSSLNNFLHINKFGKVQVKIHYIDWIGFIITSRVSG